MVGEKSQNPNFQTPKIAQISMPEKLSAIPLGAIEQEVTERTERMSFLNLCDLCALM
jgi:hypothetical protein